MTGGLFDVRSSPPVDPFYDDLEADDQADLGRIATLLRVTTWPDGVLKFEIGPQIACNDTEWVSRYRVVGQEIQLLAIWNRRLGLPRSRPGEL